MSFFELYAVIITVAVTIAYLNHRFLKMQTTISILAGALLLSMLFIIIGHMGFHGFEKRVSEHLDKIDFHHFLMNGVLSFLLFAGALTVDINDLRRYRWEIGILATVSTVCSALLVGGGSFYLLNHVFDINIDFVYCLLFGALISPTDPIAVLAIFRQVGAPKQLDVSVAGESLFNDGVGIVLFLTIYQLAFNGQEVSLHSVSTLFAQQALGGMLYGILLGMLVYKLIAPINDHIIEILLTLAIPTGGYLLAEKLHISGPLAMVVSGIFLGNKGRQFHMKQKTREYIDTFWEIIDELLNAMLFLLIGLELLIIKITPTDFALAACIVPFVLLMRFTTVGIPFAFFKRVRKYEPYCVSIMTWGGLRGGLAIALALALPANGERDVILMMTYAVVVFAILVQGTTVKALVNKSMALSNNAS